MTGAVSTSAAPSERRYAWRGLTVAGEPKSGILIALDAASARAMLRHEAIFPTELNERGRAPEPRPRAADVTRLTRQLASLLRAGLPLAPALDLLGDAPDPRGMSRVIRALVRDLTAGLRLSAALGRRPRQFGTLYCQLVAVGEASGSLAAVLARLADDRERAATQRARVRAALTYPAAILLLALAITAALLIWVVPTFRQIFDGFGAPLPAPTLAVLALSAAAARWSLPLAALFAGAGYAWSAMLRRSAAARLASARLTLRLPVVGALLAALCAARWSRALGTLLAAGTPLADAFDALVAATGNACFDHATREIAGRLRRGERLAAAMRASGCFAAEVVQPIAVAEESGALDTMLLDIAALCERRVDDSIAALSSLCEPLVIAVLGVLVGGLVIAMYLPVIQLGNVV